MFVGDLLQCLEGCFIALASLTSLVICCTNGPSGSLGAAPTAEEPQAVAARATEIPTNASLISDPVDPHLDISTSASSGLDV